jgi:peptidoglycan/xylan/chitin deacetylase (PgdA/CDA1 family)
MLLRWTVVTLLLYALNIPCFAIEEREIAITIDDLPFVGSSTNTPSSLKRTQDRFMAIVKVLIDNKVPATGFAIGGAVAKNEWDLLETFRNQGFALGNHTYTHKSLGGMSAEKYIADIARADEKLARVMTEPKYFRYPYLAEGSGVKKQKVLDYLTSHQYTVAPVTIDSKDYEFNAQFYRIPYRKRVHAIEQFKKRYLAFIWKQTLAAEHRAKKIEGQPVKQILLIHANLLNSLCLEDVIQMYQKNGYKFISLADALKGNTGQPLNDSAESSANFVEPLKEEESSKTKSSEPSGYLESLFLQF